MAENRLSIEQQRAVDSDDPAIVVVASAGSGKTEVVARRVERILSESPGESFRVLALSYTVKAADELAQRFEKRLGDLRRRVDTNTVHGFSHSLLRQYGTRIGLPVEPEVLVRDEDRAELLARWLAAGGRPVPNDFVDLFRELDLARAEERPAHLLDEWQAALNTAGALDYASMLARATELLKLGSARRQMSRLYGHVIVDEAQNLTAAQYALLTTLVGAPKSPDGHVPTMIVGDDKQSIVSFAGADPTLIVKFAEAYGATRFELRQNFRSAAAIVALGDVVAEKLGHIRSDAPSTTEFAASGRVEVYEAADELHEGQFVAGWVKSLLDRGLPKEALAPGENGHIRADEIAVLGRSAAVLRATRVALESVGHTPSVSSSPEDWLSTLTGKIVFEIVALRSASSHKSTHWQLARLLDSHETAVNSPNGLARVLEAHEDPEVRALAPICEVADPASFFHVLDQLEMPPDLADQRLAAWDADCRLLIDAWRAFIQQSDRAEQTWGNFRLYVSRLQRGDDLAPGVRLLTIHKAQGREFRAVVLLGLNDGQLPDFRALSPEDKVSELRTFYVAVTRPSRLLLMTRARYRQTRFGSRKTDASPYLSFASSVS